MAGLLLLDKNYSPLLGREPDESLLNWRRGRNAPKQPELQYPDMGFMESARYAANNMAGAIREPLQYMTPGVGDYMAHQDAVAKYQQAQDAFGRGDYLDAAMYGLGGLGDDLTTVPGIGDVAMIGKGLAGAVGKTIPALALMTAYHGTPHKFPPTEKNPLGEFDLSKIGTGEGAQAYGHGIYLAENPSVAKGYQVMNDYNPTSKYYLDLWQGDKKKAEKAYIEAVNDGAYGKKEINQDVIDSIRGKGSMYEVDLPDTQIEKMLDWDAPLSEQPESVRKALEQIREEYRKNPAFDVPYIDENMTGEQIYKELATIGYRRNGDGADHAKFASEWAKSLGIPGIKYYDAGSRTKGKGTRNFVIFDPEIAKIINRK